MVLFIFIYIHVQSIDDQDIDNIFFVNWEIERLVEQYMRSLVLQPFNTKLAPIDQNLG